MSNDQASTREWWETHEGLVILAKYLAYTLAAPATEVADAVEKPWQWNDEYQEALAELEKESTD